MSDNERQEKAVQLQATRSSSDPEWNMYPNGSTARSLAASLCVRSKTVLDCVGEQDDVPPWVLMLLSQAAFCLDSVERYLSYSGVSKSRYRMK